MDSDIPLPLPLPDRTGDLSNSETAYSSNPMSRSTFDEFTSALASYSRAPTPDPLCRVCCCKRARSTDSEEVQDEEREEEGQEEQECEHCQAWIALREKLEERLVLAAKVSRCLFSARVGSMGEWTAD